MNEKQILDYLDSCHLPVLDNGYYYHADQELKIYRNKKKWLIVLQFIQYNNHILDIGGFTTIVYKYGSNLSPKQTFTNDSFYHLAKDGNIVSFLEEENTFESFLNPLATNIYINENVVPIEHSRDKYTAKGIVPESNEKIMPWEVLRYITPNYSDHFWIDRNKLKIDIDLKEEIKISNWEHPDDYETIFSDMNSFNEIAKCLALNLDFNRNKIETEQSNTHWKNWPRGGTL